LRGASRRKSSVEPHKGPAEQKGKSWKDAFRFILQEEIGFTSTRGSPVFFLYNEKKRVSGIDSHNNFGKEQKKQRRAHSEQKKGGTGKKKRISNRNRKEGKQGGR